MGLFREASQIQFQPFVGPVFFLKQYEKFSTFLRNELCSNNLADFGLKKGLDHLEAVRHTFRAIFLWLNLQTVYDWRWRKRRMASHREGEQTVDEILEFKRQLATHGKGGTACKICLWSCVVTARP